MWPRSEEERLRARHCGFVAFVNRQDAARAKDALNEREIMGYVLRIGWGKARATPPAPFLCLARIATAPRHLAHSPWPYSPRQAVARPQAALTLASIQARAQQQGGAMGQAMGGGVRNPRLLGPQG